MRILIALSASFLFFGARAQSGWMPLSREVERPYMHAMQRWGAEMHTAIRPYRISEVRALDRNDSIRPVAALSALDRWAGARNGRKFRWGPLVDASVVYDAGQDDAIKYRTGGGLWTDLDAGTKLNFHLDAQGWNERFASYLDTLVRSTQVTLGEGYANGDTLTYTHYDWNGHVSWDASKYFNFTLGKGRNFFGEGHRSLMLSDEAYSYPYLRITTTIWKIKYVNLFTMMNDIRGADGDPAKFKRKYTSMHYLSWNASKRLNVALFEAIVWSDGDSAYPRGFDVNYLNPVIFYRPVEFSVGSPDNAILGVGFNVKLGRRSLIYSQLVLDEFLLWQVRAGDGWFANKQALQLGLVSHDAFKIPGLTLRAEWNFVRPFMYTHSDTRQNYSHMGQPLAHPYGSGMQEALVHAEWSHGRWFQGIRASMAWLGNDTTWSNGNNIFRPESDRQYYESTGQYQNYGYRVGQAVQSTTLHIELRAGYLVDPSSSTRLELSWMFRAGNPEIGDAILSNVIRAGVVCYFHDQHPEQEVRYVLH
ncbi:MAG: hypothetical protein ABI432_11240 [Flavobacteriales bacterium]